MDFTVSLDSGEELQFFPSLPPELLRYQSLPTAWWASGEWGTVIFQSLQTERYTTWYARYFINTHTCLHIRAATAISVLHIALKNSFDVEASGGERIHLKEEQFNISYFPAIDLKLRFLPGEYTGFSIRYPGAMLRRLTTDVDEMRPFVLQAEKGIACHLNPVHLYASRKMLDATRSILDQKYFDVPDRLYIKHEAAALLMLALRLVRDDRKRPIIITDTDRFKMDEIRGWLVVHYDDHGGLAAIARKFAINEFKLKRDFKAVFGTTVIEFSRQIRMERARQLLLETKMPIADIAYTIGYKNGAHFSDAFRKRYGYPPSYLRSDHYPHS